MASCVELSQNYVCNHIILIISNLGTLEIVKFGNLGFVAKYNFENLKLKIWGILEFSIAKGGRERGLECIKWNLEQESLGYCLDKKWERKWERSYSVRSGIWNKKVWVTV